MSDPFLDTIQKLTSLAAALRRFARDGQLAAVADDVERLRTYPGCFYCVQFRRSLTQNYAGVCNGCPCHTLGERTQGRPRAYNGCYARAPYREMVRLAQWFRTNPDASSAAALADACEGVVRDMHENEAVLR